MKPLSDLLPNIAQAAPMSDAKPNTSQAGSTQGDGKKNTRTMSEMLDNIRQGLIRREEERKAQKEVSPPKPPELKPKSFHEQRSVRVSQLKPLPLSVLAASTEGEIWLTEALGQCCSIQKAYGKQMGDLQTMVTAFHQILAEYPLARVQDGFRQYIKRNSTIPTPADIVNLIDPLPPHLDATFYRVLIDKKKNGGLSYEEYRYVSAYEENQLEKLR